MKTIKINFAGFWKELSPEPSGNLFSKILSERYNVEISEHPDFLFCSPLGDPYEYLKYDNCVRICFTGEPLPADFILFDYMIGFDFLEFGDRYMRYPYCIYQWDGIKHFRKPLTEEEATNILKSKTKFCNFIYSHSSKESRREEILTALNSYKTVDSAGTFLNNQPNGNSVRGATKFEFLQKSKFTICGESISYPGFTTEKIIHSFNNCSIPIYSGDPLIEKVFNSKAFIHCSRNTPISEIVDRVREIDENDKLFIQMLMEPITIDPDYCHTQYEKLKEFLFNIFDKTPEEAYRRIRNYKGGEYQYYATDYAKIHTKLWFRIGKKLKLL